MTRDIRHHLDTATLMAFSAGSLGEALSAVAAAHIEMCRHCQDELADLDLMGALLLNALPQRSGEVSKRDLPQMPGDGVAIAGRDGSHTVRPEAGEPPVGLARKFRLDPQNVPWRRLGPGVWHYRLPLSAGVKGDLRLLKIAAGRRMPEHGHGGTELTLVLDGAYSDQAGRYCAGDLQDVDCDVEHQPVADERLGCVCIVASERPAQFKGLISRLLQPLTGM
jgi:putative transcriptional regulator